MKINLNGKSIEVTVFEKRKNNYEYYIGATQIGEIDTNISRYENIVMRQNSIIIALQKMGVIEKEEMVKSNTLENELSAEIKDQIDNLDKDKIQKEAKETKMIDKYIEESGIERKRIKDVQILELGPERKKEKQEKQPSKTEKVDKEKATTKNINVKQEIELDERANDMHNIRKWLGGKVPQNIEKIGVIESYQMNEMKDEKGKSYDNETTRYSLVAISKDGTVEPLKKYIPELQQRSASGSNPTPQKYQVRDDGSVDKDSILSEYEIGDKIIQLDNKEMGRIEMNIGEESRDSTETMGVQVRDRNTIFVPDTSQRSVIGEYEKEGEDTVEKNLEEIKAHYKEHDDCTKADEKDIDGDPTTKSEHQIEEYVKRLKENEEIDRAFTEKEIREMLENKIEAGKDIEKIEQEISEDASNVKTRDF